MTFDEWSSIVERLRRLGPATLTPRTNAALDGGLLATPTKSPGFQAPLEALLLDEYGLREARVAGDGNPRQLRSLSHMVNDGDAEKHAEVRARVVQQLRKHDGPSTRGTQTRGRIPRLLRRNVGFGRVGRPSTLQAFADAYARDVWLLTDYEMEPVVEVHTGAQGSRAAG